MNVLLLTHTPHPEHICAAAAKLCYSASAADSILSSQTDESAKKFISMLNDLGHESPIEHASFTFAIEGVSRSLLAQITRHRIASYSVRSQRYVKEGQFEYVVPPEIAQDTTAKNLFIKAMEDDQKTYDALFEILYKKHYNTFIEAGVTEKKAAKDAEKKAIEDARFVLPNACETKLVVTMNARTLLNFFRQRCCERAQWEIRDLAWQMLREVKKVAPALFEKAGPSCVGGACSEGKMSCGKAEAVRQKFAAL